jgi:RNA polymerase sigma-B factor
MRPGQAERLLFERACGGDRRARERLIERYLPLARSVARRYERPGEPLEDLVQVASLALVKAIDGYDPDRGYAFTSYAVPTISGELKRHFRDHSWAIRPPRDLQELVLRIDRATSALCAELNRAPTVAQLAAAVRVSDEDVLDALQARSARDALSLHAPLVGDDATIEEILSDTQDAYGQADARLTIDALLRHLRPRTREVLRLRFEEDLTQAEIGARFGVSQMQISRIVRDAVAQLRHIADQQQHQDIGAPDIAAPDVVGPP